MKEGRGGGVKGVDSNVSDKCVVIKNIRQVTKFLYIHWYDKMIMDI